MTAVVHIECPGCGHPWLGEVTMRWLKSRGLPRSHAKQLHVVLAEIRATPGCDPVLFYCPGCSRIGAVCGLHGPGQGEPSSARSSTSMPAPRKG